MSEFLKPFNLISLAIALIGLGLAVYFYISTLPVARVQYVANTDLVARLDSPDARLDRPDLTIAREGRTLETRSLFRTIIGVWNAGTVPIDPGQVRRWLTVEFPSSEGILDSKILVQSSSLINLKLDNKERTVIANWDHLDPNYYVGIAIYHYKNETPQASLRYIGDTEILQEVKTDLKETSLPAYIWFGMFFLVVVAAVIGGSIGGLVDKLLPPKWQWVGGGLFVLVFGGGIVYISVLAYTDRIYTVTRSTLGLTIPKEISQIIPTDKVPFTRS